MASTADAQDENVPAGGVVGTTTSTTAIAPAPNEHASPREADDDKRRPVAITVNPLGFAIERYGFNVEVTPVAHHAIVGNLHLQSMPVWIARELSGRDEIRDDLGSSLGGELGYRLYSGRRGANGLFVGGSFVSTPLAYPRIAPDLSAVELTRFQTYGAALDIGAQAVWKSGFTLGVGLGVMYLAYDLPNDPSRVSLSLEPHVFPRLLLAAGWSF